MKKTCSIIYNPNSSGVKDTKVVEEIKELLKEKYDIIKTYESGGVGTGIKCVKEANKDSDLIVSIGGDGTFNEIIKGICEVEQKATISHIPMGTMNDLGRTFNLSVDPITSMKKILNGKETKIDILTINNIPFGYVSAFGYLTCVASDTPEYLKKAIRKSAYIVYGGTQALKKPEIYKVEYEIDGKKFKTECILGAISNSKGFAGFEMYNDFKLNDGKFEIVFVPNLTKIEVLKVLKDMAINKKSLIEHPNIVYHQASNIKLHFENVPSDSWNLDGENETLPKDVEIKVGHQVRMLLPEKTVNELCIENK